MGRIKDMLIEISEAVDHPDLWPGIEAKYRMNRGELELYIEDEEIAMLEWEKDVRDRELDRTEDKYSEIASELEESWDNFKPHIGEEVIKGDIGG